MNRPKESCSKEFLKAQTYPAASPCRCLRLGSSLCSGWPHNAPLKSQASSSTSSLLSHWLSSGLHSHRGGGTVHLHSGKVCITYCSAMCTVTWYLTVMELMWDSNTHRMQLSPACSLNTPWRFRKLLIVIYSESILLLRYLRRWHHCRCRSPAPSPLDRCTWHQSGWANTWNHRTFWSMDWVLWRNNGGDHLWCWTRTTSLSVKHAVVLF